jgi:2,5-furandicarboxylate decarboxylase 1
MDESRIAPPPRNARGIDFERFRLKNFLETLPPDEIEMHDAPAELADVAAALENNAKAVWFRKAGPEGASLAGNVAGSRARLARAFGVGPDKLLQEVLRRLGTTPEIVEVSRDEAPVQEVVLTGDAVDVTTLPVHLQHGKDGGLYISAAVDYAIDAKNGWTNVGMRRLMLRARTETGIDLVSPSDLRAIYLEAAAQGKPLPLSFTVGQSPIDMVAATMRLPVNELGLVAALRDAPLPVVKCVTNDIRVPADAEYVIEGYLDPRGHVEDEGPYGEFLGYYGGVKRNPVYHVTAITRRRDAVFQTVSIGGRHMDCTDSAQLVSLRTEATVWRAIESAVREPVTIYASTATGGMLNVRIALRQRVPGEARNAILAALASLANIKNVFVVDPDIDIFSDAQMDWAMATRFQPDRDLIVEHGLRTLPLDPSLGGESRVGAKAGFDLTWPFGGADKLERSIPAPPELTGARFPNLRAALEQGPKFFAELMAARGSRDGRELVTELDALRKSPGLTRDAQGRYVLSPATATGS